MSCFVYIIQSADSGKYYIGQSENLERRIAQHNSARGRSTKSGVHWELKYVEEFPDRKTAMNREREIKNKKSRRFIEWLISQRQ